MKRRIYSKVSIFVCIAFLFCCMPFRVVNASNVQDQSKPIFGLTADDVVEKYNQLSNSQKSQVLRALGNTSIFSNSLFGNIFNSTFGVLDDAIEKIGDLFFQANGVIYKLGSSALAWVSRLIDKIFNNDLNDLNISQPVINDLYLNTRNLYVNGQPFFTVPNKPLLLQNDSMYNKVYPLPVNNPDLIFYFYYYGKGIGLYYDSPLSLNSNNALFGVFVVKRSDGSGYIFLGKVGYTVSGSSLIYVEEQSCAIRQYQITQYNINWDYQGLFETSNGYALTNFQSYNFTSTLSGFLANYIVYTDHYFEIDISSSDKVINKIMLDTQGPIVNLTNNTYYNYIYNVPDQTPLNVYNIVSNTAIDYSPVDNIAYYLPDQYNIEQNFSVVNNYYISSGSAITTGSVIDVNLVSPSVIDVRITNPEDISNLVENNTIKQIINNNEFNAGDLNLNTTISTVIDSSNDSLSVVQDDSVDFISGFYSCIPPDLLGLYLVEFIVGIAVIWLNVVNHKHK